MSIFGKKPAPEPAEAETIVPVTPAEPVYTVPLEDGGSAVIDGPNEPQAFRVQGVNGFTYDHVSEDPDGQWLYRKTGSH